MKNFKNYLAALFVVAFSTAAIATTDVSGSPFGLLSVANTWKAVQTWGNFAHVHTGAETHSGAEVFSNGATNFSNGDQLFGVAETPLSIQTFNANGTWTKPSYGCHIAYIEIWSGGGSGAARATTGNAGGGGGGFYYQLYIPCSALAATETVVVGASVAGVSGNTAGTAGNASSMTINGVTLLVQGPSAAATAASGVAAVGGNGALTYNITYNGTVIGDFNGNIDVGQGGDVTAANVPEYINGLPYQNKVRAGGGGGASSSTAGGVRVGGVSILAGAGGAGGLNTGGNGTNGTAPAGGGGGAVNGGTSGSGAAGLVRVTVY